MTLPDPATGNPPAPPAPTPTPAQLRADLEELIVRDLVGHGVGHQLHEEPDIANYGTAGIGPTLRAGMTIAIEPMANLGVANVVMDPDGWTIRTRDGQPSAHFEHTVLLCDDGAEVLTESLMMRSV